MDNPHKVKTHLYSFILAIPFLLSIMYVLGTVLFLIVPLEIYGGFANYFGFWRTVIFGTLTNVIASGVSVSLFLLAEKEVINTNCSVCYAMLQIGIILFCMLGYASGLSW